MKKIRYISILVLLLLFSCNKPNEKKSEKEINKIDLKELLSKPGNYWYVYDIDSVSNKFLLTINCWKFNKDGSLEAGWFFDDSLSRDFNAIAGHKIFPENWNCSKDNKTLYAHFMHRNKEHKIRIKIDETGTTVTYNIP